MELINCFRKRTYESAVVQKMKFYSSGANKDLCR